MAIATGTALALAAASSAGGNLIGAKLKSNAAKNAAKAQQQGTAQAQQYMQQGLSQLGSLYAPYINSGAGAMGTIGRLTTPGPGATYASPGPPNTMPQPYGMSPGQAMPRYGGAPIQGGTFAQMAPPQGPPQMAMNTWSR